LGSLRCAGPRQTTSQGGAIGCCRRRAKTGSSRLRSGILLAPGRHRQGTGTREMRVMFRRWRPGANPPTQERPDRAGRGALPSRRLVLCFVVVRQSTKVLSACVPEPTRPRQAGTYAVRIFPRSAPEPTLRGWTSHLDKPRQGLLVAAASTGQIPQPLPIQTRPKTLQHAAIQKQVLSGTEHLPPSPRDKLHRSAIPSLDLLSTWERPRLELCAGRLERRAPGAASYIDATSRLA
jgi:hypothetical protein